MREAKGIMLMAGVRRHGVIQGFRLMELQNLGTSENGR